MQISGGINFIGNINLLPPPSHVTSNLITYLDASNSSSYSGSGTSWFDLSGNNRTATLVNSPTYNSAEGTFTINGSSYQYIQLSSGIDYNSLGSSRNFSVCCSYYITNFGVGGNNSGDSYIIHGTGTGYFNGWRIINANGGTPGNAYTQNPYTMFASNNSVAGNSSAVQDTANRWQFIGMSQSGATVTMFTNGQFSSVSTFGGYSGSSTDAPAKIGLANTAVNWGVGRFIGRFGVLLMYDRALTNNEIMQNYDSFRGRYNL